MESIRSGGPRKTSERDIFLHLFHGYFTQLYPFILGPFIGGVIHPMYNWIQFAQKSYCKVSWIFSMVSGFF